MILPGIPTKQTAKIEIPVQFSRLRDIAYNLWWTWSQPTRALFHTHRSDPLEALPQPDRAADRPRARALARMLQRDTEFIRAYRAGGRASSTPTSAPSEPTWFERRNPELRRWADRLLLHRVRLARVPADLLRRTGRPLRGPLQVGQRPGPAVRRRRADVQARLLPADDRRRRPAAALLPGLRPASDPAACR